MKIYDFTVPELDRIRHLANFTKDERQLFEIRSQGESLDTCAERMNISTATAKRISRRVNTKISKVI